MLSSIKTRSNFTSVRLILLFLIIVLLFSIAWCSAIPKSKLQAQNKKTGQLSESVESKSFEDTIRLAKKSDMQNISSNNDTSKLRLILWCDTSNPLCIQYVPSFESRIFDEFGSILDMFLVTTNESYFFSSIPQIDSGVLPPLQYDILLESCEISPRWVLLRSTWESVLASCGWEKSLADLEKKLKLIRSESSK